MAEGSRVQGRDASHLMRPPPLGSFSVLHPVSAVEDSPCIQVVSVGTSGERSYSSELSLEYDPYGSTTWGVRGYLSP